MSDIKVEELEPRKLMVKDLFKVATILSKCGDKLIDVLKKSGMDLETLGKKVEEAKEDVEIKDTESDKDAQIFGVQIFNVVLSVAEAEIKPFLADLVGMKVEEFEVLPYEALLVIVRKLAKKENLFDFFQRATKLVEMFKPSGKKQTS